MSAVHKISETCLEGGAACITGSDYLDFL